VVDLNVIAHENAKKDSYGELSFTNSESLKRHNYNLNNDSSSSSNESESVKK